MTTKIRFKMHEGSHDLAPRKAHNDDAAYDLSSRETIRLEPGDVTLVPTGLFLELPLGFEAQIRPRSGLALKHSVTVLNSPGTVDSGYRGEVRVILKNEGTESFEIVRGDRIAQMLIQRLPDVELVDTDELAQSVRGDGGFGSTGIN